MTRIMSGVAGDPSAWRAARSAPRMILPVDAPQVLAIHMGVDLRGGDVGVTEHLLNGAQVGAPFEQMGGEGVPERMWRDVLLDPGLVHVLAQDLPGAHATQRLAAGVQQQHPLPLPLLQPRPQLAHVDGRGADRGPADGHEALLASLAEDAEESLVEKQISHAERDPLGDAESRAVGQLEHRAVAEGERLVERRRRDEARHLVRREDVGQRAPPAGALEPLARIADHVPLAEQEAEVRPDGRDVAADGGWGEAQVLQVVDVVAQQLRIEVERTAGAARGREGGEPRDVAVVRLDGAAGGALLQEEEVREALEQEGAAQRVRAVVRGPRGHRRRRRRRTTTSTTTAVTPSATSPAVRLSDEIRSASTSHRAPTLYARTAIVPYQSAEARAMASDAVTAGTRSAPATGGTRARTPGRKRLRKSAGMP